VAAADSRPQYVVVMFVTLEQLKRFFGWVDARR